MIVKWKAVIDRMSNMIVTSVGSSATIFPQKLSYQRRVAAPPPTEDEGGVEIKNNPLDTQTTSY